MSERTNSNVSPLPGRDQDVADVEELVERLLVTELDADATWSVVRDRIRGMPNVVPSRSRRRRRGLPLLAVAAALFVSGVAWAGGAQRDGSSGTHARPSGVTLSQLIPGAAEQPDARGDDASPTPGPGPSVSDPSPAPVAVPPIETSTGSPSAGSSPGSTQQPGQDQQDGQGQDQASPDPSGQDQQDKSGSSDGSSVQSDTSVATSGGDQGSALASSVEGDQ
jgi:hypothetical protein